MEFEFMSMSSDSVTDSFHYISLPYQQFLQERHFKRSIQNGLEVTQTQFELPRDIESYRGFLEN